jgi:hypothetical protein
MTKTLAEPWAFVDALSARNPRGRAGIRAAATHSARRCSRPAAGRLPSPARRPVKAGEMVATVLQPIVEGTKRAITREYADKLNNFVFTE